MYWFWFNRIIYWFSFNIPFIPVTFFRSSVILSANSEIRFHAFAELKVNSLATVRNFTFSLLALWTHQIFQSFLSAFFFLANCFIYAHSQGSSQTSNTGDHSKSLIIMDWHIVYLRLIAIYSFQYLNYIDIFRWHHVQAYWPDCVKKYECDLNHFLTLDFLNTDSFQNKRIEIEETFFQQRSEIRILPRINLFFQLHIAAKNIYIAYWNSRDRFHRMFSLDCCSSYTLSENRNLISTQII